MSPQWWQYVGLWYVFLVKLWPRPCPWPGPRPGPGPGALAGAEAEASTIAAAAIIQALPAQPSQLGSERHCAPRSHRASTISHV